MKTKNAIITLVVLVLVVGLLFVFLKPKSQIKNNNQTLMTKTLEDGLKIEVLKEGTGAEVKNGDYAIVNYTGMLDNGSVFDSNIDPKFNHVQPFGFTLGAQMVIRGWEEGVLGMKVGEKRKLTIPSELGYGAMGHPPVIPQNATLTFEVELIGIK